MILEMTREQWRIHLIMVLQHRSVTDLSFILGQSIEWINEMIKGESN